VCCDKIVSGNLKNSDGNNKNNIPMQLLILSNMHYIRTTTHVLVYVVKSTNFE
jgi:hypothetical protein